MRHVLKKSLALLLCLVMCLSLFPATAVAAGLPYAEKRSGNMTMGVLLSDPVEQSREVYSQQDRRTEATDPDHLYNLADQDLDAEPVNLDTVSAPPEGEYYYNQLSITEKEIYTFLAPITQMAGPYALFAPDGMSQEEFETSVGRAMEALIVDQPRFHMLWESRVSLSWPDEHTCTLQLFRMPFSTDYWITKSEARLNGIISRIDNSGDRYTKLMDFARIVAEEMSYDFSYEAGGNKLVMLNDCATGPLAYNTAVCRGFAQLCKIVCDLLVIPCMEVGNVGHAWNYVQMDDGNWYAFDLTKLAVLDPDTWFSSGGTWPVPDLLMGSQTDTYQEIPYSYSPVCFQYDFFFPILSETAYEYDAEYTDSYITPESVEEPEGQFVYEDNGDGTCTIVSYEGKQDNALVIPESLDGLTVTKIGESAFLRCNGFSGGLVIPDTVTEIEYGAFLNCTGLSGELRLPDGLCRIGPSAFYGCRNLTGSLVLPDTLEELGSGAFYGCRGFTGTLYFPAEADWDKFIFQDTGFNKIVVGDKSSRYSTVDGVLYDKEQLTLLFCPRTKTGELIIPDTVREISAEAVRGCQVSGKLILPESLEIVGGDAFYDTKFSGDLVIPEGTREIGNYAFTYGRETPMDGSFFGSISIGQHVEIIGNCAFQGCSFTGSLKLPSGLKVIGRDAFQGCGLSGILEIPETVESIGDNAFNVNHFSGILHVPEKTKLGRSVFLGNQFALFSCGCPGEYQEYAYPPCGTQYQCPNCGGAYFDGTHQFGCWTEETVWDGWNDVEQLHHICTACGLEESIPKDYFESEPEIGHDFAITWKWEGNAYAAAQFTCKKGDCDESVAAVITVESVEPSCEKEGSAVYTAAVEWQGTNYTDKRTEILPALEHEWGEASYQFDSRALTMTATHICGRDESHTESETVALTVKSLIMPEEKTAGEYVLESAEFENPAFEKQSLLIELPALGTLSVLCLPEQLTAIEAEAFEGADCEAVLLPAGVTTIGSKAFANCAKLRYVYLPEGIEIAPDAFDGCEDLLLVYTK